MAESSKEAAWLAENRRNALAVAASLAVGVGMGAVQALSDRELAGNFDRGVLVLLAYLAVYTGATAVAFTRATPEQLHRWADREGRGTWLQRYVFGTAPGPGLSITVSLIALLVTLVWLPGGAGVGSELSFGARVVVGTAGAVVCWLSIAVSFAIAYHADDVLADGAALRFPDTESPTWSDYVYFAVAVNTTFGTTDVTVTSTAMRRTVSVHALLAFVFNTVILASVVGVLAR